jgi:sulfhydrogenase subunit beta (sulfur reductase)
MGLRTLCRGLGLRHAPRVGGTPLESPAVLTPAEILEAVVIDLDGLQHLLDAMAADGRTVIGPVVRDGVITLDRIEQVADLPAGVTADQQPGRYRLEPRHDGALFGWSVGPDSWRRLLFPPWEQLLRAERLGDPSDGDGPLDFTVVEGMEPPSRYAFFGIRSCDLHAIAVQDRVLIGGSLIDEPYAARRADVLLVAVHCSDPAPTCFCTSMGTGPRAPGGYDLALTELVGDGPHEFLAEAATARGVDLLRAAGARRASVVDIERSRAVTAGATARMTKNVETDGIRDLLLSNLEHPRWDDVASRCLACTNCTLVCPTCFCATTEESTDLTGTTAGRWRRWDSCFTLHHSFLHGGHVRSSHRDRYRQWLTHKLATWIDQFGSSGCVGCGRCIVWCPVGIDLTEEVAAIRAEPADSPPVTVLEPPSRRRP